MIKKEADKIGRLMAKQLGQAWTITKTKHGRGDWEVSAKAIISTGRWDAHYHPGGCTGSPESYYVTLGPIAKGARIWTVRRPNLRTAVRELKKLALNEVQTRASLLNMRCCFKGVRRS